MLRAAQMSGFGSVSSQIEWPRVGVSGMAGLESWTIRLLTAIIDRWSVLFSSARPFVATHIAFCIHSCRSFSGPSIPFSQRSFEVRRSCLRIFSRGPDR
jgi:hypothetical protein